MGGVAGVATYPEYRRSGYVKELLQHSLQTMKKDGYTVSMLHPFAVAFYRKYGWELCANLLVCHMTKSDLVMKKTSEWYCETFPIKKITQKKSRSFMKHLQNVFLVC